MSDACVPAEGAEDGSLHWVEHPEHGKFAWKWKVAAFCGMDVWSCGDTGLDPELYGRRGWRYIGPASPHDASALAEARAQIRTMAMEAMGRDCGNELVEEGLRAQVAALAAANAAMRRQALEDAATVCDEWISLFSGQIVRHSRPDEWACAAVRDIADSIRAGAKPRATQRERGGEAGDE